MRILIVYFLLIIISSCSNRSGIPKDIIPPDSMQVVLREVFMANEYAVQFIAKDSLRPDKVKATQDQFETIFKIHHISRAEFKNSLSFYESRPDLNKMIFDSLSAYANRHRNELYAPKPIVNPPPIPLK